MQNKSAGTKLPFLVKAIAVLQVLVSLQLIIMVFISLYMHFFAGYPIPGPGWGANHVFLFLVAMFVIAVSIGLLRKNRIARILSVIILLTISLLNLRAEIFIAESPSVPGMIFNMLYLLSALYLIFSKYPANIFGHLL